jgi:hypothetical protein
MRHKQAIAVEIALQTHVLKTCPIHNEIFCDNDVDPSSAFALAVELVTGHRPDVDEFHDDLHGLTDLLSATIGAAPTCCPVCTSVQPGPAPPTRDGVTEPPSGIGESSGLGQGFLQSRHVIRLGQQEHVRPAWTQD